MFRPKLPAFLFRVSRPIVLVSNHQASLLPRKMYTDNVGVENSEEYVDLRSDTVTKACAGMRKVMAEAVVGDDVYNEDPSINSLEKRCAELFDKEAALFVVTGTMGNLLSIMAHTKGRGEIIVGQTSHIQRWELGGYARVAGVSAVTVPVNNDGTLPLDLVKQAITHGDGHRVETKVICLENTHNFSGGKPLTLDYMRQVRQIAGNGIKIHVDGARIFNAALSQGCKVGDLVKQADSVQMCFSKGLGAPVGSIIAGSHEFIKQARLDRKMLGGGWRQAGHLAAAAHFALDQAETVIADDHRRAQTLASGINALKIPNVVADAKNITNMVLVTVDDPERAAKVIQTQGVLVMHFDEHRLRAVVHRGVNDADIRKAILAFGILKNDNV